MWKTRLNPFLDNSNIIEEKEGKDLMEQDYQQLMEDLRAGKIESFTITANEFMDFQPIFHSYEFRQQLSGTAKRGGEVEYRLLEEQG